MALGLTQSLTEIIIRNISRGKDGQCVGLTNLLTSCDRLSRNSESPNNPAGAVKACIWIALDSALFDIKQSVMKDIKRRLCWWEV
jgi:hypothetical protein